MAEGEICRQNVHYDEVDRAGAGGGRGQVINREKLALGNVNYYCYSIATVYVDTCSGFS